MDTATLITQFKQHNELKEVPENELKWLAEHGRVYTIKEGDFLFEKGDETVELHFVISGHFRMYGLISGSKREFGELDAGSISGILPYSRMKEAGGYGQATTDSVIFSLHKDLFPEMIRDHYQLTLAFVHQMTNRVRNFTAFQQQNEKLIALGRLSAGLTHELNNPASAIVRSATELKKHLARVPDKFKKVIRIKMTEPQIDKVNDILFARLEQGLNEDLSLMERSAREDEIVDILEDAGIEDGYEYAENFVEFGFTDEDFDTILSEIPQEHFATVIQWMDNNLTTERMVLEISEASSRISDLISSVKSYTYMDQSLDKQPVDIRKGIRNTLRMLQHKLRKANIEIVEDFQADLGEIEAFPGELNQVWTNLIHNAIDAMEGRENQRLTLKAYRDKYQNVRVEISDSGTGIPEDIKSKIFDPFFTTKDVGQGTGLGLDLVKKIIDQHKGDIKVDSEPGRTTFELCFPG